MEYNKEKDIKVKTLEAERGKYNLVGTIYSYDGGPEKIQLNRSVIGDDKQEIFKKLGRLNKGDVEAMIPIMQELAKELKVEEEPQEE